MTSRTTIIAAVAGIALAWIGTTAAQDGGGDIVIGNLYDMSGPTAGVGAFAGQGKIDALDYINANGGINGRRMVLYHVDYGYEVGRAMAAYRKWRKQGVTVIQGWGTSDTEALSSHVTRDQIPYLSMSYAASLADPTGKGPATKQPAPYNFFAGPSYSDGVRALLQWAAADWQRRDRAGAPRYVHMGEDHPYPNAPKEAGEQYAKELGFEVLPAIGYALRGGDFSRQCQTLKTLRVDYAFLANTGFANAALLTACDALGVGTQFLANIWGMDESVMKAVGESADGVVWVMSNGSWHDEVPGSDLVRKISRMSDPGGKAYRPVHYIRGICSVYYMKEALEWADRNGGITGPNIKQAMYQKQDWVPAGLEGVCPEATWQPEDHRAITKVPLYQAAVKGDTAKGSIADLFDEGTMSMQQVFVADVPRRPEWLGW